MNTGNEWEETLQGSFLKYTAHMFKQLLKEEPKYLSAFKVETTNKHYEFWQRDSLAIPLYTQKVAFQKLDYIHNNPLSEHLGAGSYPSGIHAFICPFFTRQGKGHTVS